MRYWSGRYVAVAHTENSTHCSAVRKSESTEARRSASCSLSPANARSACYSPKTSYRVLYPRRQQELTGECKHGLKIRGEKILFTRRPRFPLVSVHEEAVPGSAEHATELRDGKSIGVTAHCRNTPAQMAQMKRNISTTQPEHPVTDV